MSKEILYGINPVYEALKAGRREVFKILIAKGKISKRLEQIAALAGSLKISVEKFSADIIFRASALYL